MIGNHIHDIRLNRKISQQELGRLVGLDQTSISRVEKNKRKVTVDELMKFARALNVTTQILLNQEVKS